jgi:hypothetical protein
MAQNSKMLAIVYAMVEGFSYQNPKLGNSDGTVAGTAAAITLPAEETDPRLNSFIDPNGVLKLELCNRGGAPGQKGSGTHRVLNIPTGNVLPAPIDNLEEIANPYATVSKGDIVYFSDFDTNVIQAADMTNNYALLSYDGDPAYSFVNQPYTTNCGVDLELIEEPDSLGVATPFLYALFSSGDSYAGPWGGSTVTRLAFGAGGQLIEQNRVPVGSNATNMTLVSYTRQNVTDNYLLVSCVGGTQGNGNGADSVVSVVKTGANMAKIADPLVGTFKPGQVTLDFKGITSTPAENNVSWVIVMCASYSPDWMTDFSVRQTTADVIIEKAYAIQASAGTPNPVQPIDVSEFAEIDLGEGIPGYFWTVIYVSLGSGIDGKLIIGRGHDSGDQLKIYDVTSNGVNINSVVTITAEQLYGVEGALINTLVAVARDATNVVKAFRAHIPHPVTSGQSSMADFIAKYWKKTKK